MDTETQLRGKQLLKNGIKPVHEAFADYMLVNPGCKLREMGEMFGYSVPWICTVINSDMFKAYFAGRRGDIAVHIMDDLPTRLAAAGQLATERIIEVLEKTEDSETIIDSFDKILHRLGYAPNAKGGPATPAGNVQNNNFFLGVKDMNEARALLIDSHSAQQGTEKVLNALPAPAT